MRPWVIAAQSMAGGHENRMEADSYDNGNNLDDRHYVYTVVCRPIEQYEDYL